MRVAVLFLINLFSAVNAFLKKPLFNYLTRRAKSYCKLFENRGENNENESDQVNASWLQESNKIEYVMGSVSTSSNSFEELGLSVIGSGNQRNISIIPFHLTSSSDLFCNRELNMEQIGAIGFDMDWTLAQYKEEFDLLAYNGAVNLLVETFCYPSELYSYRYYQNAYRRGCLIDKKRGNILKLDRHRYVRVAEHGLTALSRTDRKSIYKHSFEALVETSQYENIDTPFSLIDACLFAQLVDLKDKLGAGSEVLQGRSYQQLWVDLRKCVDLCHRNGVIKLTVAQNPEKYIAYDPNIFPMLDGFRAAGRKVFLLTNSLWDYTQVVMSYLEGKNAGANKDLKWTESFDVIIVGGNKPAFLTDDRDSLPLYRVRPSDGALSNLEFIPNQPEELQEFLSQGKVFQGGNAIKLHKLLKVEGSRVLYTGDHIYSDILRTKRSVGWRTCLIVPELGAEMLQEKKMRNEWRMLAKMRSQQAQLEDLLEEMLLRIFRLKNDASFMSMSSSTPPSTPPSEPSVGLASTLAKTSSADLSQLIRQSEELVAQSTQIDQLQQQANSLRETTKALSRKIRSGMEMVSAAYHPRFGPLFRAGFQESRFGVQICDYACVYTSRASNLGFVSPMRPLRPPRDLLPHDRFVESAEASIFLQNNNNDDD